jgi:DHA2 family multidrug resistance protein
MSMAVGATLTQTYWEHMGKFSRAELVNAITPSAPADMAMKAINAGVPPERAPALFSRLVDGQSIMLATNDFYALAALLMLGSAALIWFVKKPKGPLKAIAH